MVAYFKAKYDIWILLITFAVPLLLLALAIFQFSKGDRVAGSLVLVVLILALFIFWFAMPRGYVIEADRIRIVLGRPLVLNIHFDSIQEISVAPAWATFAYIGVRFSTSMKSPVLIRRTRGANYIISPDNQEEFIGETTKAIEEYRGSK